MCPLCWQSCNMCISSFSFQRVILFSSPCSCTLHYSMLILYSLNRLVLSISNQRMCKPGAVPEMQSFTYEGLYVLSFPNYCIFVPTYLCVPLTMLLNISKHNRFSVDRYFRDISNMESKKSYTQISILQALSCCL